MEKLLQTLWNQDVEGMDFETVVQRKATVIKAFKALDSQRDPRLKTVMEYRYGLNDSEPRTHSLRQIGHRMGISKERARQLLNRGLERLRIELLREVVLPDEYRRPPFDL